MRGLRSSVWQRDLLWAAGDLALALGAFYLAFRVRIDIPLPLTYTLLPVDRMAFFFSDFGVVLAIQLVLLYLFGFYDPPLSRSHSEITRRLGAAVAFQGLLLAGFFLLVNQVFPRSVLLLYLAFDLVALIGWRWLLASMQPTDIRRLAIAGSGAAAGEVARALDVHGDPGLEVVGFVPLPNGEESDDPVSLPCLGALDDLPHLLEEGVVDDVVLAPNPRSWQTRILDRLAGIRPTHSSVLLLPGPFESLIGRMRYRWVHDLPLIEVVGVTEWNLRQPSKRVLDLLLGSFSLLLSLPVMALCALAVRLASPGPVFYRQVRIGRGMRPFTLWKLRTMREDAERGTGEVLAEPDDPRLTPVGAVLRRYRLDELPQLFNVLGGSMSLVGPRPERPGFVRRYLEEVPGYAERFSIPPGITGLAQISGGYHSSAQNKLRYDLAYLANRSLWLDLSILLRTLKSVFSSRGT